MGASSVQAITKEEKKKEELQRRIEELRREKMQQQETFRKKQDAVAPNAKNLDEVIDRYEKLLVNCDGQKNSRCSDVFATLANLYYDEARDKYIGARQDYEKAMDEWERKQVGPEPINPLPDYSKSVKMYERLINEYPQDGRAVEANFQLGNIFLVNGDLDKSRHHFSEVVRIAPTGPRTSASHFRLADFAFIEHDHTKAIKHLEKINDTEIGLDIAEMVHYRKAECYYNMADLEKSVEYFFGYREKCDKGSFSKCEFRDDAVEFLAIAFADMGNGGEEATKFFKKVGSRPYEDLVLYTIGIKNRKHGQYDDAIVSLQQALQRFPNYKDAPFGQQMLVECYLIKKDYDKANAAREQLVDNYKPGTQWWSHNDKQRASIEAAQGEVKRALSSIAIYNHALAQKQKNKELYQKALDRYLEFFTKFPDDKWRVYEFKYNIAEIYNTMRQYENAASAYDFVASQDLAKFPEYIPDFDTAGLDQDELERLKKETKQGPRSISQEDAGYNAIVALDNARKQEIAKKGITEEQAFSLPVTKKFLEYIPSFAQRFPQSNNAADVMYLAGNVYYSAKAYDNAIREFQYIINTYPTWKDVGKALRMLANSYANSGNYDLAMSKYRELLAKQKPGTAEYSEVVDLVAGAMFKKADGMKASGNLIGAADAYKSIFTSYPASKVADRGWFEAAVCYELAGNKEQAAVAFAELGVKFVNSDLREKAFVRAAENYKSLEKWEEAAQVFITAANTIKKAEFAIPSLSSASECYQKVKKFDLAGRTFELIYERYASDPKTPQALYNAGLIFEKGQHYESAIKVYTILATRFVSSEFAAEAQFSIGLCYEKMNNYDKVIEVFGQYAKNFTTDRYKQVQSLVKAGDAAYKIKRVDEAQRNYQLASVVFKEYGKKSDIDINTVARAYYMDGQIIYDKFNAIQLDGRTEKIVQDNVKEKTRILAEAAKPLAKAIELGVEEWTVKATYKIGMGFVDMAQAVANQKLFGSNEQKIASKIRILSSLEKYYQHAQEYFYKNIDWSYEQGVKGEYVDSSKSRFLEMMYRKGDILEEVGRAFKSAPVPDGLSEEEQLAYRELLEEKMLEAMDASLPKYEEGMKAASQLGIPNSPWLEKIKERISAINPSSEVLAITITERVSKQSSGEQSSAAQRSQKQGVSQEALQELERSLRRIRNIMEMSISVSDKITQLNRIEREAQRNIIMEEGRIKELNQQQHKSAAAQ
jgi:tetratricopeptide (TPR) repeat protein